MCHPSDLFSRFIAFQHDLRNFYLAPPLLATRFFYLLTLYGISESLYLSKHRISD